MYILECSDGTYYTGSTVDLSRRLWEHENGAGANHTRKRRWVRLVYAEEYDRVDVAFYREKQIRGWSRKKKEALIRGDQPELHRLAECKNVTRAPSVAARHAEAGAVPVSAPDSGLPLLTVERTLEDRGTDREQGD